jgi:hypothetical protein
MRGLKEMLLEASLLDIDGTFEDGDKYEKDLTVFFDEINKHLKNVKLWNIRRPNYNKSEWVCFSFDVPINETIFKLIEKPLDLKQYKIENLFIEIKVLWDNYRDEIKGIIELMLKCDFGSPIIVRYSGKEFKPTKTLDILDDKTLISGLLKPAIKNIFKPTLKNIDTLIEFMTLQYK